VVALIYLSRTLLCLGYVDQARRRRNEALADARRHSPYSLAFALAQTWVVDWAIAGAQSAARVLAWADEVLAISGEHGYPLWMGMGEVMRGWSLGALGQAGEGVPLIRKGIATFRSTGCNLTLPFHLSVGAETFEMYGQPVEASHWLADAAKLVETTQERCVEAEMDRLRGTLLLSMAEPAAVEENFQHALVVARRQGAKTFGLRAATSLARLWRDQGKRVEARDVLAAIYNWFTEGYDTPVLQDAKALLDQLT
jgi:predicted ATPase